MSNKFSNLSDYEINKRVAEYQDFRSYFEIFDDAYFKAHDREEVVYLYSPKIDDCPLLVFDPCEDHNDAMPIVFENNISLLDSCTYEFCMKRKKFKMIPTWEYIASVFPRDKDGFNMGEVTAINKNPLRAAMEVFLLMKDAEK